MIKTTLANGMSYDMLGFGTYKITGKDDAKQAVLSALDVGYRRIDTAVFYENEERIGLALKETTIPREEIFITTKLWTDVNTYQKTIDRVYKSMALLGVDYIDCVLIHWPHKDVRETWRALEDLYFDGKLRAIGVSNFKEHHLEEMKEYIKVMPLINQVELHPYFRQEKLREYCKNNNILVEAWSPLMRGEALEEKEIVEIAKEKGATPAQVILVWDILEGVAVIPKSTRKERMEENFGALTVELNQLEVDKLKTVNRNERRFRDPDNHGFGNQ